MDEKAIRGVVEEQAKDDGIWFIAETCAEAYLQQELRRLHAVIEGKTPEQCAKALLDEKELRRHRANVLSDLCR